MRTRRTWRIPTGAGLGPENYDKLAQRNLVVTLSDNPGPPATHRAPQTFDTRPSAPLGIAGGILDYPDVTPRSPRSPRRRSSEG